MAAKDGKPAKSSYCGPPTVKRCTCKNEQQDEIYGKGYRLWNHAPSKNSKPRRYRCTVCLIEKEF
jgi:hypothetical protein